MVWIIREDNKEKIYFQGEFDDAADDVKTLQAIS